MYRLDPGPVLPEDPVAVMLAPRRTVAPIGSQVVLTAGVRAGDGFLRTNQRLEWSIAPGSVGQFVDVEKNGWIDMLLGDFNRPRKVTSTFAIGSTSRDYVHLTRGAATPADDLYIRRGEAWITVTSPVEGTSHVSVVAPEVVPWDGRLLEATIYWIDALFGYPPPSINPAGSQHILTTTVVRQSNQAPHVGWIVRYQIVGGPPAGFIPDGSAVVEVLTNAAGQASAEIAQKQPAHGTNNIAIQVIRPAGPDGERLVMGSGSTLKTWTAADISVHKTGPATAAIGATVTYRIEVSNPGDLVANDVALSDETPDNFTYLNSTPPAEVLGKRLSWRLGPLTAGQKQVVEVNFRAMRQGSVANCAEVTAAGGLKASDCATTTVVAPTIDLDVTNPPEVAVGSDVTFEIAYTNRSQMTASGLIIKDRFGPGLEHEISSPIKRTLDPLEPGKTERIGVTFHVTRAGRLCHTVQILSAEGVLATKEACVTAVAPAGQPPVSQPPLEHPGVSVKNTGPAQGTVGQMATFSITVTNTGSQALTNITVVDRADAGLEANRASEGAKRQDGSLAWTIPSLPPGQHTDFEIEYRCMAPSRLCNRVVVTSREGATGNAEAWIDVRPQQPVTPPVTPPSASPKLSLTVAALYQMVTVGKEVTYEIRVKNDGSGPDKQAVVAVTVPAGMVLDTLQTSGPTKLDSYEKQIARFQPSAEIGPGATLTYRVRVIAKQPGIFHLLVDVSGPSLPQPLHADETTEVFAPANPKAN
jgi:uncharacterized repeat protein (TIGR01451 family)